MSTNNNTIDNFNDPAFIAANLHESDKKFSDYPEDIRNNELFIYNYFSKRVAHKSEYKHIPEKMLNNTFFVHACLEFNPDIYLLTDPKNHSPHYLSILQYKHRDLFIKYAPETDRNNMDYCLEALKISPDNYRWMPEHIRGEKKIFATAFTPKNFFSRGKPNTDMYLFKYLPEEKKEDVNLIKNILFYNNLGIFPYLSAKMRDDESICTIAVGQEPNFFKLVSDRLKNDENFVKKIWISSKDYSPHTHEQHRSVIIRELPIKYFTEEFCKNYETVIREQFKNMGKEHRSNPEIISTVYKKADTRGEIYSSITLNKITDEKLQSLLKQTMKDLKALHRTHYLTKHAEPVFKEVILRYFMTNELEEALPHKESNKKKIKV